MEPASIKAIHLVRDFRYQTGTPVYFTLDAGPNLHLLYPHQYRDEVSSFIKELVQELGEGTSVIDDYVGSGPQKIDEGVEK
jgi:diphosphomevalonate decarboxylase